MPKYKFNTKKYNEGVLAFEPGLKTQSILGMDAIVLEFNTDSGENTLKRIDLNFLSHQNSVEGHSIIHLICQDLEQKNGNYKDIIFGNTNKKYIPLEEYELTDSEISQMLQDLIQVLVDRANVGPQSIAQLIKFIGETNAKFQLSNPTIIGEATDTNLTKISMFASSSSQHSAEAEVSIGVSNQ